MREFEFRWDAKVTRSVVIKAESEEEAYKKWLEGGYGKTDVDDEDMADDYVEFEGELYYNDKFEKVQFGNQKRH